MKKILLFLVVIVFVIFIYNMQSYHSLSLFIGDTSPNQDYSYQYVDLDDYRVTDLINDINNNIIVNNKNIQYLLVKCDRIMLSIGVNDIISNKNINIYDNVDQLYYEYDHLFSLIRKFCKEKIIFQSLKSDFISPDVLEYANERFQILAQKYSIDWVE